MTSTFVFRSWWSRDSASECKAALVAQYPSTAGSGQMAKPEVIGTMNDGSPLLCNPKKLK